MDEAPVLLRVVPHSAAQILEQVRRTWRADRMHGVEPQPVEAIAVDPMQGVLDRKSAYLRHPIVDGTAPGCARGSEELRSVGSEVISFRPKMVVDDVEENHQAAFVRRIDQGLEIVWASVDAVRRIEQHAVVAPIATAGKIGD